MEEQLTVDELVAMADDISFAKKQTVESVFAEAWGNEDPLDLDDPANLEYEEVPEILPWSPTSRTPVLHFDIEPPVSEPKISRFSRWRQNISEAWAERKANQRYRVARTIGQIGVAGLAFVAGFGIVRDVTEDHTSAEARVSYVADTLTSSTSTTSTTIASEAAPAIPVQVQVGLPPMSEQEAANTIRLASMVAEGQSEEQILRTLDYAVFVDAQQS